MDGPETARFATIFARTIDCISEAEKGEIVARNAKARQGYGKGWRNLCQGWGKGKKTARLPQGHQDYIKGERVGINSEETGINPAEMPVFATITKQKPRDNQCPTKR